MNVLVESVNVPDFSSIGFGYGRSGRATIAFAGDHRMMRTLGEVIDEEGPQEVDVETWQLIHLSLGDLDTLDAAEAARARHPSNVLPFRRPE